MRDYFGGMTREDLEKLALRLVLQGAEGLKVDFKRTIAVGTNAEKAEFAKDVSSIANTDDHLHLDDFGFIVVGADRGAIVGGAVDFAADKVDSYQARITDVLREWIAPVPSFSLVGFHDTSAGPWGIIVLPPSVGQPHILIRDGQDASRHDWWVRVNDTKARANVLDYARLLSKTASRVTRPLELELQRLSARMDMLERGGVGVRDVVDRLHNGPRPVADTPGASLPMRSLAQQLRSHLATPVHQVEDALLTEALRVAQVMNGESPENPWHFRNPDPSALLNAIEYLERETRPLAEAVAIIARYDDTGSLTNSVKAAFEVLAREPAPSSVGTYSTSAPGLRLYPVALCLYSLAFVGTFQKRGDLLRAVFSCRYVDRNGQAFPLMHAIRCLRAVDDVFKTALQQQYFEAVAERLSAVVPLWCSSFVPAQPGLSAFLQAEFVVGLAYLAVSQEVQGATFPFPGKYLYAYEARSAIGGFLQKQPSWLQTIYGRPILDVLQEFDQTVGMVVSRRSFGSAGFAGGAVLAWNNGAKP